MSLAASSPPSTPTLSEVEAAHILLRCLDLTSLNEGDDDASTERLCQQAMTPHDAVAAVCVWPRLARLARRLLPAPVRVAAVANFPHGGTDVQAALADVHAIVAAGAQEVDVVMPWHTLPAAATLLHAVRAACPGLTLKVILESGELPHATAVAEASQIALQCGADFLKTSTGKAAHHASVAALRVMLDAIESYPPARGRVGLKPSGGIRTVTDALPYLGLVRERWGEAALTPARLRFGASSLLADVQRVLSGTAPTPNTNSVGGY